MIIESRGKIKPLNGDRNILKNIMQKVNIGEKTENLLADLSKGVARKRYLW